MAGAFLLTLLASLHATPSALAAAPAVVSEVAATATSVAEPASAAPTSATAPPAAPAPAPDPAPAPPSTPVAETASAAVEHSLGEGPDAAASRVVHEVARQSAAAVDAVAESGGATHLPIVEGTARRGGEAANSLVAAGEAEVTKAAKQPAHDRGVDTRPTSQSAAAPAEHESPAGPPSPPSPNPADAAFSRSSSVPLTLIETHLTAPGNGRPAVGPTAGAARWTGEASTSTAPGDGGRTIPAVPSNAPAPAPLANAAATSVGGGSGSVLLLLGVLALFALAAPRSPPPRLLAADAGYRPAPFVYALERPG